MMRRAAMMIGLVLVTACGEPAAPIIDARSNDATERDGDPGEDASPIDAADVDAAAIDATAVDAPTIDAAEVDAPAIDAPAIDAAELDAPAIDATALDAPAIDATPIDAPSIDAAVSAAGCADGTREGFVDQATFPAIAACAGVWAGDVVNAAPLCAEGWHLCRGPEAPLRAVTYAQAVAFTGCFAVDAAQDNWMCYPGCSAAVAAGVDTAANVDLGGVGASCPYLLPGTTACFTGGRIDVSENSGTGCNFAPAITTGAVCCASVSPS